MLPPSQQEIADRLTMLYGGPLRTVTLANGRTVQLTEGEFETVKKVARAAALATRPFMTSELERLAVEAEAIVARNTK